MADKEATAVLFYAVAQGRTDMIKKAVKQGADLFQKDQYGFTALMKAAEKDNTEALKALLDAGADINDYSNYTAVFRHTTEAFSQGNLAAALEARASNPLDDEEKDFGKIGDNALLNALYANKMDSAMTLIKSGIDVNFMNSEGMTALLGATYRGSITVVKALVKAGAKINVGDERMKNPLEFALSNGRLDIAKALLKTGVNVNMVDLFGTNLLIKAALENNLETIKFLVMAGADPLTEDSHGSTMEELASDPTLRKHLTTVIEALRKKAKARERR